MSSGARRSRRVGWPASGPLGFQLLLLAVCFAGVLVPAVAQNEVSFLFATRSEAGNTPVGAVIAHFNADGVLDLAVGNANSQDISILFGNPDGSFQLPIQLILGQQVIAVAGGDLDGNTTVDLVALTSSQIVVFRSNGNGTFQSAQTTNLGFSGALALRAAQVNGGSNLDVVVINNSSFQVLLGNGDGTFAAQMAVAVNATITTDSLTLGSLNNDSNLDLVMHGVNGLANGEVDVFLGNGDGTFQLPPINRTTAESPYDNTGGDIAVADLNGNGSADVVLVRSSVNGKIFNGLGNGTVQAPTTLNAVGRRLFVTDVNNDMLLDVLIAQDKLHDIAVLLGNGNLTFAAPKSFAVGAGPVDIQLGDITNDATKDFAVPTGASVYSAVGLGGGDFAAARNLFASGTPVAAVMADFNADGRDDLAVATSNPAQVVVSLAVLFGGDVVLGPSVITALGSTPAGMAAGHFNNDGSADLVTVHPSTSSLSLLLSNGNGTFASPQTFALVNQPAGPIAVADFNNDGNLDVALATNAGVSVFRGDGAGGFFPRLDSNPGVNFSGALLAGDFDRDGKVDLVGGNLPPGVCCFGVRISPGLGDGRFQTSGSVIDVPAAFGGLTAGDFNGDSRLDLAVVNWGSIPNVGTSSVLRILNGVGDQSFTAGFTLELPFEPYAVNATDLNSDGVLDLALTQINRPQGLLPQGAVRALLGNGDGTFTLDSTLTGLGGEPKALAAGDFDNDAKPDAVTVNTTGQTGTLLRNISPAPVPSLVSLNPSSVSAGVAQFALFVQGSNFVLRSKVRVNGIDRPTLPLGSTRLVASVPASDVASPTSLEVTVFNPTPGGGLSNPMSLTVGGGGTPLAFAQNLSTEEDAPLPITLQGSDPQNDPLTFAIATPPAHGMLSGSGANRTYTPNLNFTGSDSFTFTAGDGSTTSAPATISLSVLPQNDAPVAQNLNVTTQEDTPVPLTLQASDVDSPALTFQLVTGAPNVIVSGAPPNLTLTPVTNFNGGNSFGYKARDGSRDSNTALVSITITPVNDPPGMPVPHTSFQTRKDEALKILVAHGCCTTLEVSDPDNDPLTVTFSANLGSFTPSSVNLIVPGASTEVTYTPPAGFVGFDTFTFTASDAEFSTPSQPVTIQVRDNHAPVAQNATASGDEDSTIFPPPFSITDPDGDGIVSVAIASPPAHGIVQVGCCWGWNYQPAANYNGPDSFTYTASDGVLSSAPATVSITVNPVPDNPVANPQSVITLVNTPITITLTGSDADGDVLNFSIQSQPGNGTLSALTPISLTSAQTTYTPNNNFQGFNGFNFRVTDGTTNSDASVSITVTTGNPVPQLTSLSPNTAGAGTQGLNLTVNGSGFVSGSVARWNGSDRLTAIPSSVQVTASITAADLANAGTAQVTVFSPGPGGGLSNPQIFTIVTPPVINNGGVVNSASFGPGPGLAPGSIAAVFGSNLASSTAVASALPLPTMLGGSTMQFTANAMSFPVPQFFASALQSNIQVPWELAGQASATLTDTVSGATSSPVNIPLAPFSPGLYATNQQGNGQGAILIANTPNLAAPNGVFPGSRPAVRGVDFLEIYWTGGGAVTNRPATGAAAVANPLSATTTTPTVTIGGVSTPVLFSGLAPGFVGLYVVTCQVQAGTATGSAVPVILTIGGIQANTVNIAVQ